MDALTRLKIIMAMDGGIKGGGVEGVYQLLCKAYEDGIKAGREEFINKVMQSEEVAEIRRRW